MFYPYKKEGGGGGVGPEGDRGTQSSGVVLSQEFEVNSHTEGVTKGFQPLKGRSRKFNTI